MSVKTSIGLFVVAAAIALVFYLRESPDDQPQQPATEPAAASSSGEDEQDSSVAFAVNSGDIDSMSVGERRQFYKSFSGRDPYVPIATILPILDRGLADPDLKVRLYAVNRFVMSYYIYGTVEPGSIFNNDLDRQAVFVNMLEDSDPYIREGSFRVLAENFSEQESVATALAEAVRVEDRKRLNMLRSFASVMSSHPQIASQVYIDEVKLGAASKHPGTAVDSALILAKTGTPPAEILEPVIVMLEDRYFGSPALLNVLEIFGPAARPYLDRLQALQAKVDERILNGRDDQGSGSTTFSKERYASVLNQIENAN